MQRRLWLWKEGGGNGGLCVEVSHPGGGKHGLGVEAGVPGVLLLRGLRQAEELLDSERGPAGPLRGRCLVKAGGSHPHRRLYLTAHLALLPQPPVTAGPPRSGRDSSDHAPSPWLAGAERSGDDYPVARAILSQPLNPSWYSIYNTTPTYPLVNWII